MCNEFLRTVVPEWDALSDRERSTYRAQLDCLLDGPLNPVKNNRPKEGTMQRVPVESSSIKSIGFDDVVGMEIEFTSGGVYRYTGDKVKQHHAGLMHAHENGGSVGQYFYANVRNCRDTQCVKLDPETAGEQAEREQTGDAPAAS